MFNEAGRMCKSGVYNDFIKFYIIAKIKPRERNTLPGFGIGISEN